MTQQDDNNPYSAPQSAVDELNANEATATQSLEQVEMRGLIRRGHKMFWVIVAINFSPVAYAIATGQPTTSPGLGTLLMIAVLYHLWRGYRWAKWVIIVMYAPCSLLMLVLGGLHLDPEVIFLGAVFAVIPTLLMTRSMKTWLQYQRFPYDLSE